MEKPERNRKKNETFVYYQDGRCGIKLNEPYQDAYRCRVNSQAQLKKMFKKKRNKLGAPFLFFDAI